MADRVEGDLFLKAVGMASGNILLMAPGLQAVGNLFTQFDPQWRQRQVSAQIRYARLRLQDLFNDRHKRRRRRQRRN